MGARLRYQRHQTASCRAVCRCAAAPSRLHVRYAPDGFPEDLMFQETKDRENFQARYVLRHPWNGDPNACPEARGYFDSVSQRQEKEAQTLASLTTWRIEDIRARMSLKAPIQTQWWNGLWK